MYSSGHSICQDYRAIFLITDQGEYKYAAKLSQISVVILSRSGNYVVWSYNYMSVKLFHVTNLTDLVPVVLQQISL